MLFNSFQFAIFFPILIGLYYLIPHRYRWLLLLSSSYFFYSFAKTEYIFLLMGSTLCNYTLGILMSVTSKKKRKPYMWAGVFLNIGTLFLFKYFNFFSKSATSVLASLNIHQDVPMFQLLLPVGISFYTFQSLGYILDVYNGKFPAERKLSIFALFTAFFPPLLSGPINRARHLMPQFKQPHPFDCQKVTEGLRLILWGLVKKMVIADHLAVYVNHVYNHVGDYQGIPLIIATLFYTVQIYCDFSGYTDMARGSAKALGYDLMENFRYPYFSTSLHEFWQRWHISLSTWFRDYVYIPLGGNRATKWRWRYNIFITFMVSGLWHGANWTFVVWGALHGVMLILENVTQHFQTRLADRLFPDKASRLNQGVQVAITMCMVSFAWVFFRANSIGDAFAIIRKMFLIGIDGFGLKQSGIDVVGIPQFVFLLSMIVLLFLVEMWEGRGWVHEQLGNLSLTARWTIYTAAFWSVLISGVFGVKQEFIYFQF
ncbi:MBOAT family protein [Desulfobacter hydrogenophilus]|uniref:MBOAT family protein n=1 Tax=Desulfobacter hydrogenophilus TaxID=2291 RepID=A0A328FEG0_9BACT|nr:MBOAT family protein [Desulfobacter hydrogenophilus]NDY71509.1 MBOAT family protein [Desulfobacter hydrogenophilus]QBH11893.1 MBOAT family protein [Desulfobacter hydrogenophilus]RAM02536.1 MBOAT family protein [Desulfobacter hydrogenophilus]